MIETVVGAIAAPIFERVWKLGGSAVEGVKKQYKQVDAINKLMAVCQRYEQRYRDRHGQIKILPGLMRQSVSLESIYTAVKLLDEASIRYFRTERDLEEAYRQANQRSFQLCGEERIDGLEVAKQEQFLMVLGGPGIGKSTFLKKLGIEALKPNGALPKSRIPVLIELKNLPDPSVDLVKAIANEFDTCGFPAANDFTEGALSKGKLLVLLDGLDEVPKQNLNRVMQCIEDFADRYSQNQFVASCRIAAYSSSFRRFRDVTIAEFNDEQIEQFIIRWFHSNLDRWGKTAKKCWKLLSQPEHKATKELAQTPLLLIFLCLVYDREQILPPNRSSLYDRALNILLQEWAAQKRLERDPIYKGFHPNLEKKLLEQIAYDSFEQDRLFFAKAEVTNKITAYLAEILGAPEYLDGEAVLKAIEVQQGILVERMTNAYSFSHLTIQEYLTAQHINNKGLVAAIVQEHVLDDRWREVFLLMAELLSDPSLQMLWQSLEQATFAQLEASQELKDLVQWADSITETSQKSVETRATALYVAALVYGRDRDRNLVRADHPLVRARTLASAIAIDYPLVRTRDLTTSIARASDCVGDCAIAHTIDLARTLASTIAIANVIDRDLERDTITLILIDIKPKLALTLKICEEKVFNIESFNEFPEKLLQLQATCPDENTPSQNWYQWANELEAAWIHAFGLTQQAVKLSTKDASALNNYLAITELIVRCKEAATKAYRMPAKEWEALESRLLTLKGYEAWKEGGWRQMRTLES